MILLDINRNVETRNENNMRIKKPRKTPEQKQEIYDVYTYGDMTVLEISKTYKISTATIYNIVRELENAKNE